MSQGLGSGQAPRVPTRMSSLERIRTSDHSAGSDPSATGSSTVGNGSGAPYRQSTQASAEDAEGIFDLYGGGSGGGVNGDGNDDGGASDQRASAPPPPSETHTERWSRASTASAGSGLLAYDRDSREYRAGAYPAYASSGAQRAALEAGQGEEVLRSPMGPGGHVHGGQGAIAMGQTNVHGLGKAVEAIDITDSPPMAILAHLPAQAHPVSSGYEPRRLERAGIDVGAQGDGDHHLYREGRAAGYDVTSSGRYTPVDYGHGHGHGSDGVHTETLHPGARDIAHARNGEYAAPGPIDFSASPVSPFFPASSASYDREEELQRGPEAGADGGRGYAEYENDGRANEDIKGTQAVERHISGQHDRHLSPVKAGTGTGTGPGLGTPVVTITPDVTPSKSRSKPTSTSQSGSRARPSRDGTYDDTDQASDSLGYPARGSRLSIMTNATDTTSSTSYPSMMYHSANPSPAQSRSHTPSGRTHSPSPSPSPVPDRLHPSILNTQHGREHESMRGPGPGPRESMGNASVDSGRTASTRFGGSVRTYEGEDVHGRGDHGDRGEIGGRRRESAVSTTTAGSAGTGTGMGTGEGLSVQRPRQLGDVSTSQLSRGGSTRGVGEEADAWHVRSTYARLESEGVFGDGWDPGVERTRGGPSLASKRQTVLEPRRGSEVGDQEKSYLANLDRYGFVKEPLRDRNESRLALIPSAPFSRIPKLPKSSPVSKSQSSNGHAAAQAQNQSQSAMAMAAAGPGGGGEPPSPPLPSSSKLASGGEGRGQEGSTRGDGQRRKERERERESERTEKWMRMMGVKRKEGGNAVEWVWKGEGTSKLRRRIYKGVPDRWRMAAWWTLAEESASRGASFPGSKGKKKAEALEADYRLKEQDTIDLPSTHDVQIDLDVPRTISGHTLFVTRYGSGQRSLFHVLHCFSLLCDTCGYCQGMGPLAATLLCYFDPERTYALMVRLHDQYGMHDIFAPGFPGLLEAFYVMERLMEWIMPDVYRSFQNNMISTSAWATKWYITLFVNTVPFSTQLRVWDALWLDGRDVVVVTSLAILWAYKDLLAHPKASFESILSLLSSHYVPEDEDSMMRWIKRFLHQPGVRPKMDGWRAEWARLKSEGKDGEALL